MRRFEGKTVIVTGGGTGIGEAICHRFASEGANVVIAELEAENGNSTAADINKNGGTAIFCETDTSNSDSVRSMIAGAVEEFGTVDILVNNAAAFVFGKVEDVTDADWARVFGVNVIGYANTVREILADVPQSWRRRSREHRIRQLIHRPTGVHSVQLIKRRSGATDTMFGDGSCSRQHPSQRSLSGRNQDASDGHAHRLFGIRPRTVIHRLWSRCPDEAHGRAQRDCRGSSVPRIGRRVLHDRGARDCGWGYECGVI